MIGLSTSQNAERELEVWKRTIKNVLGPIPYKTLERIVNRELVKEAEGSD